MGKQKDFRRIRHPLHKKKDKQFDKTAKTLRTSCQENYLKSVEVAVQQELESTANAKKIGRHVRKELDRYPLLAKAAFLGCERVIDSILEAGENINVQIPDGRTPLILAVENGYPEIVEKLLKKGADPKLIRPDGKNALMTAVAKNDNQILMSIWTYWDKSCFWELNHTDTKGYTVLSLAVKGGHSHFTSIILNLNGLELDKQTIEGKTALMFAVTGGHINVVQRLLSCGSDFALEDTNGATAICLAISQNQHEIKELLYESLDSKSRDMYVKKRIELLTRPRPAEIAAIITFYKDILFRVILEIRRSFEDGVVLLEKHRAIAGLYKCLDTHQQNTDLLRIGFHLTALLIYDKAEYNIYIAEELAEQYVNTKFADFTLKIMQRHRLKGMTELRGAAFLCIHAGTQCRSGKTWLKSNYFQILPFVKEFKVILSTLTFWGDGESAKAKNMYDRFLEIFELVEKDIKISCIMPPETISNFAEQNPPPESADKDIIVISSKLSNTLVTNIDRQVVSKTINNKGSKTVSNPVVHSIANKKDYKKKNKPIKFKTKVHSKFSAKMLAQRPNLKFTPNLEKKIPTMPSEGKLTQVCYADVLKMNLRNEEISNQGHEAGNCGILQDDHDFLSDKQTWARLKAYSLSEIELDYEIDRKKLNSTKKPAEKEINVNLNGNDFSNLKINEKQTEGNFYDCWKKSSTSEYPTDLMTFITNLFRENELKNQVLSKSAQCENPELDDTVTIHSDGKQSKALRDILIALGLKTDLDKDDTDESRYTTQNKTEVTTKNKCKVTVNEANANAASDEFLYSDCLKSTPGNELSNKKSLESTTVKTDVFATKNAKHLVVHKDATIVKTFKRDNIEPYLINDCKKATEKNRNMIQLEVDEGVRHTINDNEVKFSDNSPLSLELQDNNEISNKENTKIAKNDFNRKFNNSIFIPSLKRKNPETYYRDLSFNAYKEEIKEVKVESSLQLSCNFEYCINLCRKSEVKNKMNIFPWAKMNTVLKKTITVSKIRENNNGIESCFNTYRVHATKVGYPELVRSNPTEYIDVISTGDQGICNLNLERYPEKSITMSSKNLVLHEISDDKRIFGELKNIFHMIINGKISNFDQDCQKPKKNPKFIGTHRSLLCGTSVIIPEMTLNIEKFMFLYKRLIIFQVMDQPQLSVLYMNTQCRLPITDLKYQFDSKDSATESKDLKKFDYCHHETSKMRTVKNSTTFFEEYKMLKKFKSEINQIMSYLPVYSTKSVQKQHKYLRRVGMCVSTVFNKMKRTKEEVPIHKDTKSINTSFTLCNNAYGYKPNFINCEQRSRWYEKLQRIESCVPLATFLVGFGVTERAKCNLHEIISATGKIVFSSKEEHILRQGDFGTRIGIMANGNPVIVRMFKKTGHKTLELLSTGSHLDHKNIVSFYCLCSSSNDQRMFAVSELMEFSLAECIKMKLIHSDKSLLIRDLLNAIQYFQRMQIVHGFLKPSNVMITLDGRLKVSDFYMLGVTPVVYGIVSNQSTKDPAPIGASAISDFCWRPYELIAATTEMDAQILLTKASDIQMTGMLIYYILSGGKHPFGSTNVQCQENIRDGTPEFGPRPSDIESRDLVRDMIRRTPSKRLTLQEVTKHPYLWNIARRIQFLADVARKIEFFIWKPTKIAEALHDSCIEARDWTCNIHPEILKCVSKWTYKVYANNYSDLLHFILSINDNFEILPQEVKSYMVHPSFFISATFPTFFMSVYCVLRDNPLVHQQMALQAYF